MSLTLALALTMFAAAHAGATQIAAVPCATSASVERGTEAMRPFFPMESVREQAQGMVLLDCRVQHDRKLRCAAPSQSSSGYDLRPAALAFASELEVCPGTQPHLMFPLVFRPETTPSPSP
ncbi:MAG: hypothetical protein HY054_13220 [Proteobacteria bacterium]|nr:hypothetical protein [Pseudomonadota bacterium]